MGGGGLIVLDTHVLVWWVSGGRALSRAAARRIEKHATVEGGILVSSISAWEIAMLVSGNRLILSMDVDGCRCLAGRNCAHSRRRIRARR